MCLKKFTDLLFVVVVEKERGKETRKKIGLLYKCDTEDESAEKGKVHLCQVKYTAHFKMMASDEVLVKESSQK